MMNELQKIAAALARGWVRLYTSGMPSDLRDVRRAEIEADLWDHQQAARDEDAAGARIAAEILLRTLFGIPDDIGWRREVIHARRNADIEWRIQTMEVSVSQMRWIGICTIVAGTFTAASVQPAPGCRATLPPPKNLRLAYNAERTVTMAWDGNLQTPNSHVLQASVTDEIGILSLELDGERAEIKAAIAWLEKQGIRVEPVEINVIES